ncbi:hypothetical protein [Burkholderia gladioli]|uniref:hypothetical protein n=1 Tax=Burkholderia gladioli TaxID=28095 RepID=UPI001641969B|nr:hypothetical protein [Burkholderia gladioli]
MLPSLSPDAIEALKWIDRFGAARPVPIEYVPVIDALLNDGYVYQGRHGHAELTDDGLAVLSESSE